MKTSTSTQKVFCEAETTITRIKKVVNQINEYYPLSYEFNLDEQNSSQVAHILEHIEGVSEQYPMQKGILLFGSVGSGKSDLMRIMLKHNRVLAGENLYFCHSKKIVFSYESDGRDAFSGFKEKNFIFDEIGLDDEFANHYGNKTNVIHDLILLRYEAWKDDKIKSYFTTNLTPVELLKKYGERVYSRLVEMCGFLQMNYNGDRRAEVVLKEVKELTEKEKNVIDFIDRHIKYCKQNLSLTAEAKCHLLNDLREYYKNFPIVRERILTSNLPEMIKNLPENLVEIKDVKFEGIGLGKRIKDFLNTKKNNFQI